MPEEKVEENIKNRPVTEAVTSFSYKYIANMCQSLLKIVRKVNMV